MSLKEKDKIKEKIRFHTELLRLIAVGFLGTSSGVVSLIMRNRTSAVEHLFIAGGILLIVLCIVGIFWAYKRTRNLIDHGNKGNF